MNLHKISKMLKSLGWYQYAWNPVIGCKHDCSYCYAKPFATRRGWIKDYNEPILLPETLGEPAKLKRPAVIFVCAFADLFGSWVPREWIEKVLEAIKEAPQHTFVFLTKSPKRYSEFTYPENVYIGVTIESPDKMCRAEDIKNIKAKKFCSIEPILGDFSGVNLSMFDWVVSGYSIYTKRTIREKLWMKSVKHKNFYEIVR